MKRDRESTEHDAACAQLESLMAPGVFRTIMQTDPSLDAIQHLILAIRSDRQRTARPPPPHTSAQS